MSKQIYGENLPIYASYAVLQNTLTYLCVSRKTIDSAGGAVGPVFLAMLSTATTSEKMFCNRKFSLIYNTYT